MKEEIKEKHSDGFKKYGAKQYHDNSKPLDYGTLSISDGSDIGTIPRSFGKDISLKDIPYVPRLEKNKQK